MKPAPLRRSGWTPGGWLVTLASGAIATSLLRVPVGIAGIGSTTLMAHIGVGVLAGVLTLWFLLRSRPGARMWPASAVAATLALGWLAYRSFAPATVAAHAALAAITTAALAAAGSAAGRHAVLRPAVQRRGSWKTTLAAFGFVLVVIQVGLGASLRHHLVSLSWHLLAAGLAAVAVLVTAVGVAQDARSSAAERRASTLAVHSFLLQTGLGMAVLVMMMTGSANAPAWAFATVAHVVVGSVTLLAAGGLARALRTPIVQDSDGQAAPSSERIEDAAKHSARPHQ